MYSIIGKNTTLNIPIISTEPVLSNEIEEKFRNWDILNDLGNVIIADEYEKSLFTLTHIEINT